MDGMCCTFSQLAMCTKFLHQHHYKHRSNKLCLDITTATAPWAKRHF